MASRRLTTRSRSRPPQRPKSRPYQAAQSRSSRTILVKRSYRAVRSLSFWTIVAISINLISVIGISLAVFALPWLSFATSMIVTIEWLKKLLPPETLQDPNLARLFQILQNINDPSGWELITSLPTFEGVRQLLIIAPLILLGWIFLATLFGWVARPTGVIFGVIQVLLSIAVIVVLITFTGTLQVCGVDLPGIAQILRVVLPIVGVQIGPGYWICFVCTVIAMISGGMLVLGTIDAP